MHIKASIFIIFSIISFALLFGCHSQEKPSAPPPKPIPIHLAETPGVFTSDGLSVSDIESWEDYCLKRNNYDAQKSANCLSYRVAAWASGQIPSENEEINTDPPEILHDGKTTYTVTTVLMFPGNDDYSGKPILEQTDCRKGKKTISVLRFDGNKRSGVFHEMMHVATNCDLDKNLHKSIYRLEGPLLKLMQENPEMMDYLLKRKSIASASDKPEATDSGVCDAVSGTDKITCLMNQIAPEPAPPGTVDMRTAQSDPQPWLTQEIVTQPVLHCPDGWHVEVWYAPITATYTSDIRPFALHQDGHYGSYSKPIDFTDNEDKDHPARCFNDKH